MKKTKLGKIALVAGAVVFSALLGVEAVDLNDAVDQMTDLNAAASTAATQLADAKTADAVEMAKLVQAVVSYELQQGSAAVDRLKAALAADDNVAAKKAMKDLKAALKAAKNALKYKFPSNLKDLVSGSKIIVPPEVSTQTLQAAFNMTVAAAGGGAVNPNEVLTESKGVQGAQAGEADIVAGAAGLVKPAVNPGNNPGTGV